MMIPRGEEMVRGLGRLFVVVIAGIIHGTSKSPIQLWLSVRTIVLWEESLKQSISQAEVFGKG